MAATPTSPGVLALPGFDEFILGYKDRRLHVPDGMLDRIVPGGNGVFRATIVVDGVVAARGAARSAPGRVQVTVEPLRELPTRGEPRLAPRRPSSDAAPTSSDR